MSREINQLSSMLMAHEQWRIDYNFKLIGDEGAKAIAKALTKNPRLKRIDLTDNQIGDEGAKAMAKALTKNSTLRLIDLSYNQFG